MLQKDALAMMTPPHLFRHLLHLDGTLLRLLVDVVRFLRLCLRPAPYWQRQGCRLFWRWKSIPGRPPIPADLQALIRCMARENPSWCEERILS